MLTPSRALTVVCVLGVLATGCGKRFAPAGVSEIPSAEAVPSPAAVTPPLDAEPAPSPEPVTPAQQAQAEPSETKEAEAQADPNFKEKAPEPAPIDELLAISTVETPPPTPKTEKSVADDLQTIVHDIDIPQNARVLRYVELFSGKLKGYLEEGLGRGAQYLPMIQDVFRAEGLPLDLAYVPLIESAFKPTALSRAKAKGIWQFMRGTALENGLTHDWYIDERADPEKATRAAARYLKTLHGMFDDWHLALASYNGGPGRIQRAMKRSGRDDFWKLSANSRYLPRETRDYVPLILAAIVVARNPGHYGLNIAPIDVRPFDTVSVAAAVDLRRVAEWAEVTVAELQDLNPELRRWTTPVRATVYELKVPQGTADAINGRLALLADEGAPFTRYSVKKGETIQGIAKKLKVTRSDLAEANYLSTRARLSTGQQLIVPRAPALTARASSPADRPQPAATPDVVLASRSIGVEKAERPAPASTMHRVKRGETLFSIAKRYGTTVTLLKEWNGLRGNVIQIGQRLIVGAYSTN
ncbi:MAG TPA: LysM peptidoglycan-binding domain-containing protein [Vicinamibacterales bacterium]|nr:LysM peptidoglycan-binding domain-containing protein [Vicinamibacterales bacterium]